MAKAIPILFFVCLLMLGSAELQAEDGNATSSESEQGWSERLKQEFSNTSKDRASMMAMTVYLMLGGIFGLYIRFLYRRFNGSVSDADSVARIFPLLVLVTIAVISVVKDSWEISLGLLGALSIVRFRAAIKDPEELVYLFLCIGVGFALGVSKPLLALALVVVGTVFVLVVHYMGGKSRRENLLLPITGDAKKYIGEESGGELAVVDELVGSYSLQRFDIEGKHGQVRIVINHASGSETAALIARLRKRLPECEFSYVNLEATL